MAFPADLVVWIRHQHGKRIGEDRGRFVERDLVLTQVGFCLVRIPRKLVAHGSTVRLLLADANNRVVGSSAHEGESAARR